MEYVKQSHRSHHGQKSFTYVVAEEKTSLHPPSLEEKKTTKTQKQAFWRGVGWKVTSCASYAVLNVLVRYLTGGTGQVTPALSPGQLVWIQNLMGLVLILPFIKSEDLRFSSKGSLTLHALRVIFAALGIIFLYASFAVMPVAKAVALGFLGPIFTAIGAWFYLKERLSWGRFLGVAMGIFGAVLINRPDHKVTASFWADLSFLLPVASAFSFALSKLFARKLMNQGEVPKTMTTYLLIFMAPISLGLAFIPTGIESFELLFRWHTPSLSSWGWIVLLSMAATFGHYSLAKAFSYSDITSLTPFGFSRIAFSAALAFILFGEWSPSETLWLGTLVIFLGTLIICYDEERSKKKRV